MPEVFVGAGSNIEPARRLAAGLRALAERFGVLRLSPVYCNSAVGFAGDDFYNMVIGLETDASVSEVAAVLAAIEAANGRVRGEAKFAPRCLDLDLLLYGDAVGVVEGVELPRDEITHCAYVLKPLADLEPDRRHPVLGRTYSELWAAFDAGRHPLERVATPLVEEGSE